jgi:hypothetical protein
LGAGWLFFLGEGGCRFFLLSTPSILGFTPIKVNVSGNIKGCILTLGERLMFWGSQKAKSLTISQALSVSV